MNPLISIVIPSYNSVKLLPKTLDSVWAQTYTNYEVIVVDDGSTDGTADFMASQKDPRIQYVRLNTKSGGPAHPRNVGMQKAKGEYICFLDSDDLWRPEKLEVQLRKMTEKQLDFSSTRRLVFTDESEIKAVSAKPDRDLRYCSLLRKNVIFTSSVMVRRQNLEKFQFNTAAPRIAVEDYEMWLSLLQSGTLRAQVLGDCLLYYRIHAAGISKAKWKMMKKVWGLLRDSKWALGMPQRCFYFVTYALYSTVLRRLV